ncbi:MAG: cbb3-type cytochrome c oxidase subunit I [Deltaproteobacteria bacterium]|nr:cbb3-type cytochrome c oxidase subunit I [Deltaproteobacteria bacterium]
MSADATTDTSYLNAERGLWSWLTTTDHKRIALLYLAGMMFFFTFAVLLALTFRLHLFDPEAGVLAPVGALLGLEDPGEIYNRLLTLHGVVMIFLFIIPGIPAVFGNFFLPILIGAEDVSFPRLNLASWYFYVAGGILALVAVLGGGVDTGWTFYVPYSVNTDANVVVPMLAAFVLGWSSILTGLNFVTTVHRLRAKEMGWFQMPLFTWSLYATGWVQILATPVVGITLIMVLMERYLGIPIFDPARGGDPVLYQHLFWIYSHPAVYIMILPAMGVVSEIIPTFSRKTIFGYKFIVFSSMAIAGIGSLVWAHHMFTAGMADVARIVFSALTFLVAVPSAIKVFNWLATMYRGSVQLAPPMLWALMFIFLFAIGGLTGLTVASLSLDVHLHDTSYVVAHFHYTMFGGTGVIFIAGLHYWWPKIFGRMYNARTATVAAVLFFIGFNLTYIPLFIAGGLGMPRRYAFYVEEFASLHQLSTVGSWVMAGSLLLAFGNLVWSLRRETRAADDPWGGATLEWRTATPPPVLNFHGAPDLSRGAYEYPVEVSA